MITQDQLQELLVLQYRLYLRQQDFGVYAVLQPGMDAVQKQTRGLVGVAPPAPPSYPLARFDSAPSQWAKWHPGFLTPEELSFLLAKYDPLAVHQRVNWWDGQGGYKLQGNRHADGSYWYLVPKAGPDPAGYYGDEEVFDNGGADAHVAALIAPRQMVAPLG